ncbi:MAG: DUF115 domain-containing protein [Lachnospiraceae bacterium]|nr:DUF115 domain-containing protein [Lachnospiraceae bacterium]
MILQKLFLLAEKCKLTARNCQQDRTEDVLAGMGDITNAVTGMILEIQFFSSPEFLNILQTLLLAMSKPDLDAIGRTLRKNMIPSLERLFNEYESRKTSIDPGSGANQISAIEKADGQITEDNGVSDGTKEKGIILNQTAGKGAAADAIAQFEGYAEAAKRAGQILKLWNEDEAREWAEGIGYDGRDRAICMFGRGDDTCEKELRNRMSSGSILLIYEPEKGDLIGFRDELQTRIDFYRQESLLICAHPLYQDIFKHEYTQFLHLINENRTRVMVNKNTMARFKENASRNVIANLPMLNNANLIDDLKMILPNDVPVIIVAAGPSLDKNIEELKRAKGHCLIFAVDTAMKYLLAHDIMPDLGITIEPIKPMANYEDSRCFEVPHVFDCESNPEIVSKNTARKFIYNCRDYVKRLLQALGKNVPGDIASGGSVATAAFAICYQLGMKRIIMIGQDLAYQGESTHAGGIESKGINNNIGYEMIEGIDGGQVRTRSDWLAYLKWFENAIDLMKDMGKDMEVIDATEGGALIHGSKVMTLSEAVDEYCVLEYDFTEKLAKLPCLLKPYEYEKLQKLVEKSVIELDMVEAAAREAARRCEEGLEEIRNTGSDGQNTILNELTQARITCEKALLYPLINNYAVTGIAEEVSRIRLEKTGLESELLQQKLAFEAIVDACGYFTRIMGEIKIL